MQLSILVPSVHTRHATFARAIQKQLFDQYAALSPEDQARVEIIVLTDTKSVTIGTKRNRMLAIAQGEYVAFVDDDDRVSDDYIAMLLSATISEADVITFLAKVSLNGTAPKLCRYSMRYEADHNLPMEYRRLPNHLCATRRTLALQAGYADKQCGEDADYAARLKPLLGNEYHMEYVLYYYDFNSRTTETQRRAQEPIVDVVMLSRADTDAKRWMTQTAVDTCLRGADGYNVNLVVLEQVEGVEYRGARTLHAPGAFNYNQFANEGARLGSAPWLMIANNDLVFHRQWLRKMLAQRHPVMSPKNPHSGFQRRIHTNEIGTVNGRNLSGWCFMVARSVWERIGGFDEDFAFWCADDSFIEQLKPLGIKPMLVCDSQVTHLESQSHDKRNHGDGSMTWAMIHKFIGKYGSHRMASDYRYLEWLREHSV